MGASRTKSSPVTGWGEAKIPRMKKHTVKTGFAFGQLLVERKVTVFFIPTMGCPRATNALEFDAFARS